MSRRVAGLGVAVLVLCGCGRTEIEGRRLAAFDAAAPDARACPQVPSPPQGPAVRVRAASASAGEIAVGGVTPFGAFSATTFDLQIGVFNCPYVLNVAIHGGDQSVLFSIPYDSARRSFMGVHEVDARLGLRKSATSIEMMQARARVDVTSSDAIQSFPLNLILIFAMAIASHAFIERPMLRLRSRITRSWQRNAVPAPAAQARARSC